MSLYGDYVQQLGPVDQWTMEDIVAIAMHTLRRENNVDEERIQQALLALDRIETTSEQNIEMLFLRASLLERLAGTFKERGDLREAEGIVRKALDISIRLIGLSPDDRNPYRNATVFSLNLAEIRLAQGDKEGFLDMGEKAVGFQKEGASRLPDDELSRFWLAERLGHYAHMCLRVGHAEDSMRLISEGRDLIARKPFPESFHPRLGQLLQSFDQMENDVSVAEKTRPPQT
jgi:tetratricopeptide (TPR) repeat protein